MTRQRRAGARQRSVSSVARTAAGRYQVIFTSDVRNCAYFATVGDTSAVAAADGRADHHGLARART